MRIQANFNEITGVMKPMHGIGQPPMFGPEGTLLMHYIEEAGIPYSRLHDVQGGFGGNLYVDVPNIFRDFSADETKEENYDFIFTDRFLSHLMEIHCEPVYRLGVTIENYHLLKAYRIFPPADFHKWARICEHIIRHYNEGWANGFQWGIKYWEIWNEPADDAYYPGGISEMWHGTQQQYYDLYAIAATHLKKCFGDSIQVGGYAGGGFPYFEIHDPNADGVLQGEECRNRGFFQFAHEFLSMLGERGAPLDFFSWHSYRANPVERCAPESDYVRRLLKHHGYGSVPDFMNEWNPCSGSTVKARATTWASSRVFATMVQMQRTQTSMLNYYDARCAPTRYSGMFNPDTHEPYLTYYVFKMFNDAYQLKKEVFTLSSDANYPVCGASDGSRKVLLVANFWPAPVMAEFDVTGADAASAEIIMVNHDFCYETTPFNLLNGRLIIPPETAVELRFE